MCLYMYATCFGLYLGNHQAYQYKNLIHEAITKSEKPIGYSHCVFNNVKTEYKIKSTTKLIFKMNV